MTTTMPRSRGDEGRDTLLLAAQLDLMQGVLAGEPLSTCLDALLGVVEKVSAGGMLASILLLDEDGSHLLHGAAPSLPASYNDAIHGVQIGPSVGSCGTAAYRGEQVIVTDIAADPLWADFKDLALGVGLRACWSTPIAGNDRRVLGTFAMYYPEPLQPTPGDLALIDVLVRTVAIAIERSKHDEQRERELAGERALALTFQKGLLPVVPPRLGPVELAARYRTGDPGVHVGGDWFDALAVDDGIVLVVGDVQGHDARAAALMGQLRTVVRVTAGEGHPPAGILRRAADYLDRLEDDLIATVLVVHLDVHARLATTACAGHLPPVLLSEGLGGWTFSQLAVQTGPPLGVGVNEWNETSVHLPADAVLLLYTDGLVETRHWDIDEGIAMLGAILEALPPGSRPQQVLDAALGLLPVGQRGDDVAVVAALVPPSPHSSAAKVERSLPSQPMSVPLARSWTQGWLTGAPVPADLADEVLLVVSELVTNAVRQGDDPIRLTLCAEDRALLMEVYDTGYRMPVQGNPDAEATGGRGLQLIDAMCDEWGIREFGRGKVVWARLTW